MSHIIRTYCCTDYSCRNIDKVADKSGTQMKCTVCGKTSNKISTEKVK